MSSNSAKIPKMQIVMIEICEFLYLLTLEAFPRQVCRNIAAIGLISANARIRNTSNRIVFIDEFNVLVYGKLLSFTFQCCHFILYKKYYTFFQRKTTVYNFQR